MSGVLVDGDPPFVGRAAELALCRRWIDDVVEDGRPRALLLEGLPGVGKSRLAGRVVDRYLEASGQVLVASCSEDRQAPRWPLTGWVEPLLDDDAPEELRAVLAPLLGETDDRSSDDGADERTMAARRLAAFLHLIDRRAATAPVLVYVDDLQWADVTSLSLVENLIAVLADRHLTTNCPVMVLITARRSVDDRFNVVLDRIGREPIARRLSLSGLEQLDCHELIAGVTGLLPEPRLLAALAEPTGGNPLHVQALLRRLVEDGTVVRKGNRLELAGSEVLAATSPPLDAELTDRIARLDRPTQEVGIDLALAGGDVTVAELVEIVGRSTAEVEDELIGLESAGLVRSDGDVVRFAHALVRHTFAERATPLARRARHARIAEALLARHPDPDPDMVLRVAHHLERAGGRADEAVTARVAVEAAQVATARHRWADAARYWRLALERGASTEPATMALAAGRAAYFDLDFDSATTYLRRAVDEARRLDDIATWADALALLLRMDVTRNPGSIGQGTDESSATEFLEAVDERWVHERALVFDGLAASAFARFDLEVGEARAREGLRLAEQADDHVISADLLVERSLQDLARLDLGSARAQLNRAAGHVEQADDPWSEGWAPGRLGMLATLEGRGHEAVRVAEDALQRNRSVQNWSEYSMVAGYRAGISVCRGDFAEAERIAADAIRAFQRSSYYFTPSLAFPALAAARAMRGDELGATAAVDEHDATGMGGGWRYRVAVAAHCGAPDELCAAHRRRPFRPPGQLMLPTLTGFALLAEVGDLVGLEELGVSVEPALSSAYDRGIRWSLGWPLSLARLLGVTALGIGDLDGADRWLTAAEVEADRMSSPLEYLLVAFDRARWLHAVGRDDEAIDAAERCVVDFDRLGLLPARGRAVRLLASIGGDASVARRSSVDRFVVFTDLVDSTGLNVRAGDERYVDLLTEHNRATRRRLVEFDGVQVKHTGDGVCAWFAGADDALACVTGLQRDLAVLDANHPEYELRLRAGIAVGSTMTLGDDLHGLTVVAAARLCDRAGSGEVLADEEVLRRADRSWPHEPLGALDLKGFADSRPVVRIRVSEVTATRRRSVV